jgi:isoaspartyl peptidase/L-asparaginase-like protein (Ntn-hydrolase superfamily)
MAAPTPTPTTITNPPSWTLVIHGGAGVINADDPAWIRAGVAGLRRALRAGAAVFESDSGTALDAVEAAVVALEDDPLFNAGKGSVLTCDGKHELEASVMVAESVAAAAAAAQGEQKDGGDGSRALRCGAAALLTRVKNPVRAARCVMEQTPHTFLAGAEAERLAEHEWGLEMVASNDEFGTEARRAQWRRWKETQQQQHHHAPARADDIVQGEAAKAADKSSSMGTVGAVAVDARPEGGGSTLAAATSTGGRVGKSHGRVGDTPICGAGNWADSLVAVSGTGVGEAFARRCACKDLAARMAYGGQGVKEAAEAVVFGSLAPGDGGVIAVGARGEVAMPFNSPGMWRGVADANGRFEVGVFAEMVEEEEEGERQLQG